MAPLTMSDAPQHPLEAPLLDVAHQSLAQVAAEHHERDGAPPGTSSPVASRNPRLA